MATDAEARAVKDRHRDLWLAQGWHMISVRGDAGGGAYLWIGVDPQQPLPAAQTVDGVPLVFAHAARIRPLRG